MKTREVRLPAWYDPAAKPMAAPVMGIPIVGPYDACDISSEIATCGSELAVCVCATGACVA